MLSLRQIHEQYKTQDQCMELLVGFRWPRGVECPRCGSRKVIRIKHRPWNWVCKSGAQVMDRRTGKIDECSKKTGYRFSPLVGTVFENTNYKLPLWFEVIYLICQSKKGMSALQVQRMLEENGQKTAYKTALYMCHRIRAMLDNDQFPKLMGEVEADETWIGGKDKNRHWNKRSHAQGGYLSNKTMVIGAISRKGNVTCQMIEDAGFDTLGKFVREAVSDKVSLIATDENPEYRHLKKAGYQHATVTHSRGEYVRGNVHTNSIENFWSLLKRGIVGTYHNVSKKYLPLYLNEFSWRFNNRKNPNIFFDAIAGC
jgi:transposase-like protein